MAENKLIQWKNPPFVGQLVSMDNASNKLAVITSTEGDAYHEWLQNNASTYWIVILTITNSDGTTTSTSSELSNLTPISFNNIYRWLWDIPFYLHDRVALNVNHTNYSRYIKQSGGYGGTIVNMEGINEENWDINKIAYNSIKIAWDNGHTNIYEICALVPEGLESGDIDMAMATKKKQPTESSKSEFPIGIKISLNPEHKNFKQYNDYLNGNINGIKIKELNASSSIIMFDKNTLLSIPHSFLLPIDSPIEKITEYCFDNGETKYTVGKNTREIDEMVIIQHRNIINISFLN